MLTSAEKELSHGTVVSDETNCCQCCGIQYKNWVLTSGLILCPFVSKENMMINNVRWQCSDNVVNDITDMQVNLPDIDVEVLSKKISRKKFKIYSEYKNNIKLTNKKISDECVVRNYKGIPCLNKYTAYPVGICRSNLINDFVTNNISDWKIYSSEEDYKDISSDVIQSLLSVFLILQLDSSEECIDNKTPLSYFLKLCSNKTNIFRGLDIIVESTPFTTLNFYNCWSKGIVSNNFGSSECLFFTDTRLVIGCIGAPVYRYVQHKKGDLIGMVLNPITVKNYSEWTGFSVAVNLHLVLSDILSCETPIYKNCLTLSKDLTIKKFIYNLDQSVVLIRCGHSWGSGVVVNGKLGLIVTCAHVVNYGEDKTVRIECGGYKTKAIVIFSSKPGEVFDIAILSYEPSLKLKELSFAINPPIKGETVFCVGFPMMDTNRVTLSKGIIANAIPNIIIQTTCCVQPGASGGVIVRPCGSLIGIVVSNMSYAATNYVFPHCNLSIPTSSFEDILINYYKTKDVNCLKNLVSQNVHTIQKWSFEKKCKL